MCQHQSYILMRSPRLLIASPSTDSHAEIVDKYNARYFGNEDYPQLEAQNEGYDWVRIECSDTGPTDVPNHVKLDYYGMYHHSWIDGHWFEIEKWVLDATIATRDLYWNHTRGTSEKLKKIQEDKSMEIWRCNLLRDEIAKEVFPPGRLSLLDFDNYFPLLQERLARPEVQQQFDRIKAEEQVKRNERVAKIQAENENYRALITQAFEDQNVTVIW